MEYREEVLEKLGKHNICDINQNSIIEFNAEELRALKSTVRMEKDRLKSYLETLNSTMSRIGKEHIASAERAEYTIKKILSKINKNGDVVVGWIYNNRMLSPTYAQMENYESIGLSITDTIDSSENIFKVSFNRMADLIALDFIHLDVGLEKEYIEEILKDCSIFRENSIGIIEENIELEGMYKQSGYLRIEKCDKVVKSIDGEKEIVTYFENEKISTIRYREVVSRSCKVAAIIFMKEFVKFCRSENSSIFPICITDNNITFKYTGSRSKIEEALRNTTLTIRFFGRKFKIPLKIEFM